MIWIEEAESISLDDCTVTGEGLSTCAAGVETQFQIVVGGAPLQSSASVGWSCQLDLDGADCRVVVSVAHVPLISFSMQML